MLDVKQSGPGVNADNLKKQRCLAALRSDSTIETFALVERFGVDRLTVERWRAEAQSKPVDKSHLRARRRPRRLS